MDETARSTDQPLTRPRPGARAVRIDAGVAALLWAGAAATAPLYFILGQGAGFDQMPLTILLMGLLALPLALRRVAPSWVALVQAVVYFVAGTLGTMDFFVSQIVLFLGFYSIGAWERNRKLAFWSRTLIATSTVIWLLVVAVISFEEMRAEGGSDIAPMAWLGISFIINAAFYGGAWIFGNTAWAAAIERIRLSNADSALAEQRDRLTQQALELDRMDIARELHDVVAHHVSVMGLQAGAARRVMRTDVDRAEHALRGVETGARQAIIELRTMVSSLRNSSQSSESSSFGNSTAASAVGLASIPDLVAQTQNAGLITDFSIVGTEREIPQTIAFTVYRVAQEALTNARKHAGTGAEVSVRLRYLETAIELEVSDDGRGTKQFGEGGGLGLLGMRERVTAVGGEIASGPKSRGGFLVRVSIPVPAAAPAPAPAEASVADNPGNSPDQSLDIHKDNPPMTVTEAKVQPE
ncbi:sensor histidine kinase [Humidisolicoccus flavus]|uniref:sensor histidine kinase n=1 Tax=Humidisolicoccus flavus TaxID=3111414 RepID=UPI0032521B04